MNSCSHKSERQVFSTHKRRYAWNIISNNMFVRTLKLSRWTLFKRYLSTSWTQNPWFDDRFLFWNMTMLWLLNMWLFFFREETAGCLIFSIPLEHSRVNWDWDGSKNYKFIVVLMMSNMFNDFHQTPWICCQIAATIKVRDSRTVYLAPGRDDLPAWPDGRFIGTSPPPSL